MSIIISAFSIEVLSWPKLPVRVVYTVYGLLVEVAAAFLFRGTPISILRFLGPNFFLPKSAKQLTTFGHPLQKTSHVAACI